MGALEELFLPLRDRRLAHLQLARSIDLSDLTTQHREHNLDLLIGCTKRLAAHLSNSLSLPRHHTRDCPGNLDPRHQPYTYAGGDPINNVDPSGHDEENPGADAAIPGDEDLEDYPGGWVPDAVIQAEMREPYALNTVRGDALREGENLNNSLTPEDHELGITEADLQPQAYDPAARRVTPRKSVDAAEGSAAAVGGGSGDLAPVVIGRNMSGRVIPYARSIGADWYEGAPADVPPSQWLQHNADWLQEQMNQGRQIIDIGEDPASFRPSSNYNMEQQMIGNSGYTNYLRAVLDERERYLMATAH
jgi:hypothetical protein